MSRRAVPSHAIGLSATDHYTSFYIDVLGTGMKRREWLPGAFSRPAEHVVRSWRTDTGAIGKAPGAFPPTRRVARGSAGSRPASPVPGASTMAPKSGSISADDRGLVRTRRRRRKFPVSAVCARNARLSKVSQTAATRLQLPAPPFFSEGLRPSDSPTRALARRFAALIAWLVRCAHSHRTDTLRVSPHGLRPSAGPTGCARNARLAGFSQPAATRLLLPARRHRFGRLAFSGVGRFTAR
jgi:hypothetical protein